MTEELSLFDSVAISAATSIPQGFTDPDDDWQPVAFLQDKNGYQTMFPLGPFMGDDRSKDILAQLILPGAIKHTKAVTLVMVLSIWQSETSVESLKTGTYIPPSQCEDRTEHVALLEYTTEGVTRNAFAQIQRYEDRPPTLGEWEQHEEIGYEGRFVGPIVAAMKGVKG